MVSLRLKLVCGDFVPRPRRARNQMTAVKQMVCDTTNISAVTNMLFILSPKARCITRFKIPKRLAVRQSLAMEVSQVLASQMTLHTYFPEVAFAPWAPWEVEVEGGRIHTLKGQKRFQFLRRYYSSVESRSLAVQAGTEESCGRVRWETSRRSCSACLVKIIPGGRKLIAAQYHRPHTWRTSCFLSNSVTIFSESLFPFWISTGGIFWKDPKTGSQRMKRVWIVF